jgi:hypothetical protein
VSAATGTSSPDSCKASQADAQQACAGLSCSRPLCLPAQHPELAADEHVQHVPALVRDLIRVVLPGHDVPGRAQLLVQLLLDDLRALRTPASAHPPVRVCVVSLPAGARVGSRRTCGGSGERPPDSHSARWSKHGAKPELCTRSQAPVEQQWRRTCVHFSISAECFSHASRQTSSASSRTSALMSLRSTSG